MREYDILNINVQQLILYIVVREQVQGGGGGGESYSFVTINIMQLKISYCFTYQFEINGHCQGVILTQYSYYVFRGFNSYRENLTATDHDRFHFR